MYVYICIVCGYMYYVCIYIYIMINKVILYIFLKYIKWNQQFYQYFKCIKC